MTVYGSHLPRPHPMSLSPLHKKARRGVFIIMRITELATDVGESRTPSMETYLHNARLCRMWQYFRAVEAKVCTEKPYGGLWRFGC